MTEISLIRLDDREKVRMDDSGRSIAYFCKSAPIKVNTDLIEELKKAAISLDGSNVRLCLHESPESLFHEMINLEHRAKYYRPHKHERKGESYHIIEGAMAAFVFDEDGNVIDANVLKPDGNFLYRVDANMYHAVMPLTDVLIYHESKPGPFLSSGDSIFPDWAPDGNEIEKSQQYTVSLQKYLNL